MEGRALGSAALSYFLSAGSERVGLSAAAAEQLRSGCIEVRARRGGSLVQIKYPILTLPWAAAWSG